VQTAQDLDSCQPRANNRTH